MSSQAERIKAFKLAQHTRLQKQDEEEQWISSEELCTEGSSDEETHTSNTKSSHRKQKRNPRTEKRGISPLAQPPRAIEAIESTSTYQRDSKYLLPDLQASPKPAERRGSFSIDQPDVRKLKAEDRDLRLVDRRVERMELEGSTAHSSREPDNSSEESEDEEAKIERMIQWRPKRGSIKLPDFPEGVSGRSSTLQHDIFKANAFYSGMKNKVQFMKEKPTRTKFTLLSKQQNDKKRADDVVTILNGKISHLNVDQLKERISRLDENLAEIGGVLEKIQRDREALQKEMYTTIAQLQAPEFHNNILQSFLQRYAIQDDHMNNLNEDIVVAALEKGPEEQAVKKRKKPEGATDFIARNIELAKQRVMDQFPLTDEEKVKLESLLSDIDSEEYSVEDSNMNFNKKEFDILRDDAEDEEKNDINHFKLKREEQSILENLNVKLYEMLHSYDESDRQLKDVLISSNEGNDVLETADREGRYWKHHILQKRLEAIDKDLINILTKDTEEKKLQDAKNQQFSDENGGPAEDRARGGDDN